MKHVPRYVKRLLREALEAYTQQESEVLKAKLLLEEVNLKIVEVFCPVKIGDLFRENYLIRVQRIAWHYIDSPLGIYWELSGTVVKDDGTPDNRFTGAVHVPMLRTHRSVLERKGTRNRSHQVRWRLHLSDWHCT